MQLGIMTLWFTPPPTPTLDKQRNQLMLLACVHFQRELWYEIQPNSVRENWPPFKWNTKITTYRDVYTRDDSQRQFWAQHSVAMFEQWLFVATIQNNVVTML